MKAVIEVTNFVGSDKLVDRVVLWLVELFYSVYISPMQNFYAIKKCIGYDDAMGIVNHIDTLTREARELVRK